MLHIETSKQSLKTGLTPLQKQEMRLWLLSGGREGKCHESIVYSWYNPSKPKENGHRAFLDLSQSPEYKAYFSTVEQEGMQLHEHEIRQWVHTGFLPGFLGGFVKNKVKQLIELGPGNDKIEKYVEHLGFPVKEKKKIKYRAADVSQSGIESGNADAEHTGLDIGNPLLGSWNKPGAFEGVQDPLYVCFGGGFVNDFSGIQERIQNIRANSLLKGGKLLFTYASLESTGNLEDEIVKLKALYGNLIINGKPNPYRNKDIHKKALAMVMKPFEALGFPLDCLRYTVEWKLGEIILGATVTKEFAMSEGDETFIKRIGEFIPLIDSPRPNEHSVVHQVEAGGGKVKILAHKHMRYALVDLPIKKVTEKQQYTAIVLSILLGISSFAYFLGKDMENMRRRKAQDKQSQELKLTLGCSNDVYFNQLLDEILNDLQVRYGNDLTQEQKMLLTGKVLDFFSSHQTLLTYGYGGGQGMMYSTNLYTPGMMDMFIAENTNLLLSMRLHIIPNHELLTNSEALMNSYYYQGERQEFFGVDEILPDYVSEGAGVSHDGEPFYFTYPCGIKLIDGKPYFVVKRAGAEGYMLEEKTPNLHSNGGLCAGDIVTEILARGQVQIFAERIKDFIQLRYGDQMVAAMNGQDVIASFLIDLYAQGRDLGYLFGSTNDTSDPYWYLRDSPLHDFVLMYVLPVIGEKLVNGVDGVYGLTKMYDLDMGKIAEDQQKLLDISLILPAVYDFVNFYIPKYTHDYQAGKVKSIIMKHLLLDPAVGKLDINNKHSIRAWLTIHAQEFNEDGIKIPSFPTRVDDFLTATSGPTYDPSDNLQDISGKDAHAGGMEQIQFGTYTDIDGNEYDLGVYMVSFFKGKVVGRINNQFSDKDLLRRWKEGEFGTIKIQTLHGKIRLTNENSSELLEKLRDEAITYSSAPVGRLFFDYQQRKAAMEKFKE